MRIRTVVFAAALACGACQKASNQPAADNGGGSSSSGSTASGAGAAPSQPPQVPPRHLDQPPPAPPTPPPAPAPAPAPADPNAVRPPVAADLAEYTKDLPGTGALTATIDTSLGTFHCTLFGDKVPMTVANFVGLATGKKPWQNPKTGEVMKNTPFFEGITFHRVIPGFMAQGGDPLGQGIGGPGYDFDNEVKPDLKFDKPGVMGMANAGPGTNGSQFFIMEVPKPELDGGYTVFGQCDEADLVKKITGVPRDSMDKPLSPVTITKVTIGRKK